MKTLKRFAAVAMAGAMMVGGAMTSMAAETNYFYVYENGVFGPARMGQDCVESVTVRGSRVTMNLQDAQYGSYAGRITNAFVDADNDMVYDEGETVLYNETSNAIVYNQNQLKTTVEDEEYANFCIVVTIVDSEDAPVYEHNPQSVYVPMQ